MGVVMGVIPQPPGEVRTPSGTALSQQQTALARFSILATGPVWRLRCTARAEPSLIQDDPAGGVLGTFLIGVRKYSNSGLARARAGALPPPLVHQVEVPDLIQGLPRPRPRQAGGTSPHRFDRASSTPGSMGLLTQFPAVLSKDDPSNTLFLNDDLLHMVPGAHFPPLEVAPCRRECQQRLGETTPSPSPPTPTQAGIPPGCAL